MTRPSVHRRSPAPTPSLTDPETLGEDLEFNLRVVGDLAEEFCSSCQGYHVLYAAKRMMPLARITGVDRKEMAAIVKTVAEKRLASSGSSLEVVIAGTADTGLLATAAHGIALLGKSALSRSRFTVLDRCRTPLELCRYFGHQHHLKIETEMVDLVVDKARRNADLVVAHSLLRFLPRESHVDVVHKLGSWLRPEGRMIFSTRLEDDAKGKVFEGEQRDIGEDVVQRIRAGQLKIGESVETFAARLSQRSVEQIAGYGDLESLHAFFALAQMPVISSQIVRGEVLRSGNQTTRFRAIIVLGAPQS